MSEQKEVKQRIESIEGLVRAAEELPDPEARGLCKQLVQALMDLYGSGLERMLEILHKSGEVGQQSIDNFGRDDLVRSLLLLHGLHPLDLPTRVLEGLEKVRPQAEALGRGVELVGVSDMGAVTLRFAGDGHGGCHSSAASLRSTVEQAVYDAAPDVTEILVEGLPQDSTLAGGFVPLASLQGSGHANGNGAGGSIANRSPASGGAIDTERVGSEAFSNGAGQPIAGQESMK